MIARVRRSAASSRPARLWRRSVAGRRAISSAAKPLPADRWNGVAETGSKAWAGLDAIAATDAAFSGPAFVEGARKAYEIIVSAFAKGDRDTLGRLLSADVFDGFAAEISGREARGESVESALVSIDSAVVDDARALPQSNSVTVRFTSKLITAAQPPGRGYRRQSQSGGEDRRFVDFRA